MMDTQNSVPSDPQPNPNTSSFTLEVKVQGCFVFALSIDSNADAVSGIDVFAPDCGHTYRAGIHDQWNNPYEPYDEKTKDRPLLMLAPRRYKLELTPDIKRNLSASKLEKDIRDKNLWPEGMRPLGQGWDLAVSLPIPDRWTTDYMDVSGHFAGGGGADLKYMGMTQTLIYKNVEGFELRGSPLPVMDPVPNEHGKVIFFIDAEPPCIPNIDHQRDAVVVMAQMMGLDINLAAPFSGTLGNTAGEKIVRNGQGSSCMGSSVFQNCC